MRVCESLICRHLFLAGMNSPKQANSPVRTSERTFEILHGLRDLNGAGVSELASYLETPKSTIHRHLTTLEQTEYVIRDGDEFHISLRFAEMAKYARERYWQLQPAKEAVKEIATELGERSLFAVEEHGKAVYLYRGMVSQTIDTGSYPGTRRYLHSVASGKAILAHLPESRIEEIIETHGLPAETEHTITDRTTLYERLERIREDGIAYNKEECVEGLTAIATPILDEDGSVIGSIAVSGSSQQFTGKWYDEATEYLRETGTELESRLTHE